ncbi:MAG: VOC family protein [candidate division Zixibacteria bacterium]|nr:VOC family protein [candidate division Zixibacteria bacterium]
MLFKSSRLIAIHVPNLKKAERFYSGVLGFKLIRKTGKHLVYKTGLLTLYVVRDNKVSPFIPSLGVKDWKKAKTYLTQNGCRILKVFPKDRAFYFKDPFGIVIDVTSTAR